MKVTYTLSNSQLKALLVNGQGLRIALPVPPVEVSDPADWARTVLPSDLRERVVSAEEVEVMAELRPPPGRPENLTHLLGAIVPDDARQAGWCVTYVVIAVTLSPTRERRRALALQWPANVSLDGRALL